MDTSERHPRTLWRDGIGVDGVRVLAEETPVAISYNGSTHAVLMATPGDLEDLAVGFSVTEGIVRDIGAIEAIDVVAFELGLDIQVRVREDVAQRLAARRRSMAGPVGCGLCGLESLEAAARQLAPVTSRLSFSEACVNGAARSLETFQTLNRLTSSVHAAGFFRPGEGVSLAREDVGRHNAVDKLLGALFRRGQSGADGGIVVTSRVSVELVQKAAVSGAGLLAAISAPTALAVRTAVETGITLVAVVRDGSFECFTHPDRIQPKMIADVA